MACALTQGYTLGCADGIAGIKDIRLIEWEYIDTTASSPATLTAVSGTLTVITPRSSKKFWKYELPSENKDYLKETWQSNPSNGTLHWMQEVQLSIRKLSATLRNELRLMAQNRLAMIVQDRNGKYWLAGQLNGLRLQPSDGNTGAGRSEFNGYVLKFSGEEEAPMQEVDSSIIAALTN